MDTMSKEQRSRTMAAVRSKGTEPENMLCDALREAGVEARRNVKGLPGTPDLWLPDARVAIFVDGEFWHRCPVHSKKVKSDPDGFWREKFARNVERDRRNERDVIMAGAIPVRVWECEVRRRPATVAREIALLRRAVVDGRTCLADLAWMAGFVDGEGTVTIFAGRKVHIGTPHVCVANNHYGACERFKTAFGFGSVSKWSKKRKRLLKWRTGGARRCGVVLRWLKCFLVLKRPQAEVVSIFGSTVQTDMHRSKAISGKVLKERRLILKAVRSLNGRGRADSWRRRLSQAARRSWKLSRGIST